MQRLFAAYVEAKQKQNVLDYDDLLLYWSHVMSEGAVAQDMAARFDHVLVDEYQDTNRLQSSILLALKPNGRGLTVVGDDAHRFTLSVPRRYATSWTFLLISRRPQRSSPLIGTTAPRNLFCRRRMQ